MLWAGAVGRLAIGGGCGGNAHGRSVDFSNWPVAQLLDVSMTGSVTTSRRWPNTWKRIPSRQTWLDSRFNHRDHQDLTLSTFSRFWRGPSSADRTRTARKTGSAMTGRSKRAPARVVPWANRPSAEVVGASQTSHLKRPACRFRNRPPSEAARTVCEDTRRRRPGPAYERVGPCEELRQKGRHSQKGGGARPPPLVRGLADMVNE